MTSPSYPVALYLTDWHPIGDGITYAKEAEARGFDAVWQGEAYLNRDAIVPIAAIAAVTSRIKVGTGVINNWTRNVPVIAATFSTLNDLAPGRILLGIGALWEPFATKVGVHRRKPVQAMREAVAILKGLFSMRPTTHKGEIHQVDDICLDTENPRREAKPIPVYIGATGFKMVELSGEVADGILLNYLVPTAYNHRALERLEVGARRAGRKLADIDRPQLVVCSVDRDAAKGVEVARELVTRYLAQEPHFATASGVPKELVEEIQAVCGGWPVPPEKFTKAMRLVTDDIVHMITAAGSPEQCRRKVDEYVAAGCTCPVLYPIAPDVRLMLDTFARPGR